MAPIVFFVFISLRTIFDTTHTKKLIIRTKRKNAAAPFFCGSFFSFFVPQHKPNKTHPKTVFSQRSSVFSCVVVEKNLMKKKNSGTKKENAKKNVKNRRLGPRTSVIPHYYPQDHTITRPHYHKRAWHNREHEERERPNVPLVRTKQKRCFDAEERKRVPKRKT